MEIQGKVFEKIETVTGTGKNGEWRKKNLILEVDPDGKYPTKVCVTAWGDMVASVEGLNIGDEVTAAINVKSREYEGKWYTDVECWKMDVEKASTAAPAPTRQAAPQPQAAMVDDINDDVDSLPF